MLTFTVEELIRFLSNWTMTFFEGAKRSGDIVDSKTIYMASKPVKALLQSSDFIDDMDVFEKLDSIRIPLFRKNIPADPAMFQDKDTVDKAVRNACSAFLFGTRCNEFSNLIRTMYPLNDDDVIHYLSSPSDWAEETSSVITASNGTASRIYYMARLIAIDRMSELFLTFYEHDSADSKDITNVCKSMMDAVEPYKVVTLVIRKKWNIFWKKIANGTVVDTGTVFPSRLSFLYRAGARFFGKTRYSGNNRNTVACLCEWSRIIVVR